MRLYRAPTGVADLHARVDHGRGGDLAFPAFYVGKPSARHTRLVCAECATAAERDAMVDLIGLGRDHIGPAHAAAHQPTVSLDTFLLDPRVLPPPPPRPRPRTTRPRTTRPRTTRPDPPTEPMNFG